MILSKYIKGNPPESFMEKFKAATISMLEDNKTYMSDIFHLIQDISCESPLLPRVFNELLGEIENKIKQNPDCLNEKSCIRIHPPGKLSTKTTWRSPLEFAIQSNSPIEVVMKLIENKSEITQEACSIAIIKASNFIDQGHKRDDEARRMLGIIKCLSLAGAGDYWSKPLSEIVNGAELDIFYPGFSRNKNAPMSDHIISRIGEKESCKVGVGGEKIDVREIDMKEFAEKIKKYQNVIKPRKISKSKDNSDESGEGDEMVVIKKTQSKERQIKFKG